ncbi:MAG TPA: TraY domain-containing protein [Caulobacterales bacterium]|nr:TraY domain-containing protein [Caulobacterales bacterium]
MTKLSAERVPLGLRVTPATKKRLDEAATASGRSQSQEAEMRLEQTFNAENAVFDALDLAYGKRLTGLLLAIAHAAQITGTRAVSVSQLNFFGGEEWGSDPYAYDQAARAINAVLEAYRPRGKIAVPPTQMGLPQEVFTQLGEGFAKDLLAAVAKKGGGGMVRDDVVRAIRDRIGSAKA